MRPTGPELARCELTFRARRPIDAARAVEQHAAYVAALAALGLEVRPLPRLAGHPDATFVEDMAVVLDEVAVLATPGTDSRRGERESVRAALAPLRELVELPAAARLDGGDVLDLGEVVYVGRTRRTNHAALKALAHALLPHGRRVKAVEVSGALHLKTACTALDDETLLVNRRWLNLARVRGPRLVDVPPEEPFGANVVRAGQGLLLAAEHPRTAALLDGLGYAVRTVPLSEFDSAEAGATCLSLIVRPAVTG